MWSMDSGAGAYSNVCLARSVAWRFAIAMSIDGEVVAGLIHAGAFFLDLHQHIVEQGRSTEPESLRRHPVGAQRFIEDDQVRDRLLRRADAAGWLEADGAPGLAHEVADRLHHHEAHGQRGSRLHL